MLVGPAEMVGALDLDKIYFYDGLRKLMHFLLNLIQEKFLSSGTWSKACRKYKESEPHRLKLCRWGNSTRSRFGPGLPKF
jgi:hypothetical protein